jgi:PPOX class probable F420-dependent enzyme
MLIDKTTEFGKYVAERLDKDQIIWLTVTCTQGCPAPNPMWFLWDGDSFLPYNQPEAKRLAYIVANPVVSLNFDTDDWGDNVIIFKGEAFIDTTAPLLIDCPGFVEKYKAAMARIRMTPQQYSEKYFVPLRIKPTHLRGQVVAEGEAPQG